MYTSTTRTVLGEFQSCNIPCLPVIKPRAFLLYAVFVRPFGMFIL